MIRMVRLIRNGGALSVSIPKDVLAELKWMHGEHLAVGAVEGAFVVRRVDEARLLEAPPPPRKPAGKAMRAK
jgi:antitoxin component of MazEF toxin-antitoxin module